MRSNKDSVVLVQDGHVDQLNVIKVKKQCHPQSGDLWWEYSYTSVGKNSFLQY